MAEGMEKLFAEYDAVLTPVTSKASYEEYSIDEAFGKVYKESVFTAAANLIGIPALVSGSVQLMGKHFDESVLLSIAYSVERRGE